MEKGTIIHRDTKDGRRLWYRMEVIQQPERARACGSGPKCKRDDLSFVRYRTPFADLPSVRGSSPRGPAARC